VTRLNHAPWLIGAWLAVESDKEAVSALRGQLAHPGLDWQGLMAFANEQLLVPLLYDALSEKGLLGDLPDDVGTYLSFLAERNRARNKRLETQILEACRALNRVGITPMPIKGAAELLETPQAAETTSVVVGDLDILVQPQEGEAAADRLGELGYSVLHHYPAESHAVADLYRPQDAAVIDLHRHPLALPALLSGEKMWAAGSEIRRHGARLRLPSATDHLACRVLHEQVQDGNLVSAGINLRSVYQVARTLQRHGPSLDLKGLRHSLQPHGLTTALTTGLMAAQDIFAAPVPTSQANDLWSRVVHGRRLLRLRYAALGRPNNAIGNMWSPFARYRYGPAQPGTTGIWRLLKLRVRHGVPALAHYGGVLARRLLRA